MKKAAILFAILAGLVTTVHAQQNVGPQLQYNWAAAPTGTAGQLGNYLVFNGTNSPRPGNYTLDVSVSGTIPSVCTFRIEGSSDGTVWYGLDVTSPSTTSCTTSYMESIVNRPVVYLRVNLTYTQGDATTKVVFHYTGGNS